MFLINNKSFFRQIQRMLLDQPLFEKEIRFFRINPPKKQDIQKGRKKSLEFIEVEERKVHEIIR